MLSRKVMIVNAGGWGGWLSAERGDYDSWISYLEERLGELLQGNPPSQLVAEVKVVRSVGEAEAVLSQEVVDAVFFVTRGMIGEAEEMQKRHPNLKVVVFTGLLPKNEVTIVHKNWLLGKDGMLKELVS